MQHVRGTAEVLLLCVAVLDDALLVALWWWAGCSSFRHWRGAEGIGAHVGSEAGVHGRSLRPAGCE